jgi:hypothetical protein
MRKRELVNTIMTRNIHVVQLEDKLTDVRELIRK